MFNPMLGDEPYTVYRLKDLNKPMHSGNIETKEKSFKSKEVAELVANNLNEEEQIKNEK